MGIYKECAQHDDERNDLMGRLNMYSTNFDDWKGLPEHLYDTYQTAIGFVNEALYDADWVDRICDVKEFYMSSDLNLPDEIDVNRDGVVSGKELIAILRHGVQTVNNVTLRVVNPGWFNRGWIGKAYPSNLKETVLSSRYIKRDEPKVGNTLAHEFVHHVDHLFNPRFYQIGHGSNSVKSKSTPYLVGSITENWMMDKLLKKEPTCQRVICSGWWIFKRCRTIDCND